MAAGSMTQAFGPAGAAAREPGREELGRGARTQSLACAWGPGRRPQRPRLWHGCDAVSGRSVREGGRGQGAGREVSEGWPVAGPRRLPSVARKPPTPTLQALRVQVLGLTAFYPLGDNGSRHSSAGGHPRPPLWAGGGVTARSCRPGASGALWPGPGQKQHQSCLDEGGERPPLYTEALGSPDGAQGLAPASDGRTPPDSALSRRPLSSRAAPAPRRPYRCHDQLFQASSKFPWKISDIYSSL